MQTKAMTNTFIPNDPEQGDRHRNQKRWRGRAQEVVTGRVTSASASHRSAGRAARPPRSRSGTERDALELGTTSEVKRWKSHVSRNVPRIVGSEMT
jgi:hypothetical protein